MPSHYHIHSGRHHVHVHDFEEASVHRAPKGVSAGGQFTKGGGGGAARYSGPKASQYGHSVHPIKSVKHAFGVLTNMGKSVLSEFTGKEEYHDFEKTFGKPGSKERRSAGQRVRDMATAIPRGVVRGMKENVTDIRDTAGLLRNIAHGNPPTPEQQAAFRRLSIKTTVMGITGGADLATGGSASAIVIAVAEEFFNHAWKEHALKLAGGGLRYAGAQIKHRLSQRAMEGGDSAYRFSDADDEALLKDWFETLAKSIETMPLPAPTGGK